MKRKSLWQLLGLIGFMALLLFVSACKKKVAPPPPPPPPPPVAAAPTVSLRASPSMIERGASATLTWSSTNATELNLSPAIGSVQPEGSMRVTPTESTTYMITAKGPGGTAESSARVTVTAPAPPPAVTEFSIEELFRRNVQDAFFDFDMSDIREDARVALTRDADFFRQHPTVRVMIEGHCDERGTTEYNLGLGDRRANSAKAFLVSLGIAESRMEAKTWGKERPFCTESSEECWQQNRRAHFVLLK